MAIFQGQNGQNHLEILEITGLSEFSGFRIDILGGKLTILKHGLDLKKWV